MSAVLWANLLHQGRVTSDQDDKHALYKHSKKLDKLTRELGVTSFLSAQDFTDMQLNQSRDELPTGVNATDELMAASGSWIAAQDAVEMLENLIEKIRRDQVKFGFFHDDHDAVVDELGRSLRLAERAASVNGRFNFSVVM